MEILGMAPGGLQLACRGIGYQIVDTDPPNLPQSLCMSAVLASRSLGLMDLALSCVLFTQEEKGRHVPAFSTPRSFRSFQQGCSVQNIISAPAI